MSGELYRDGRHAAAWGLGVSLGLGAVKLAGGLLGGSVALVSDAAHSLVDALISAALLVALVLAQRPADREHPYGHARVESLAGQGIAVVLIALALAIGWEALSGLGRVHPAPQGFTLAIAAGGAIFQEGLYRRTSRVARRIRLPLPCWRRPGITGWMPSASLAVLAGVAAAKWGRAVVALGRLRRRRCGRRRHDPLGRPSGCSGTMPRS